MKIFITGGSGFIGTYVINKLQNEKLLILNYKKKIPNHQNIQLINGTLENIEQWRDKVRVFKPDATIHLAWEGIPDYSVEMSTRNLNHGLQLYKFLSHIKCKTILTAGSCWEYGGQQGKLSENTPYKPFNAFTSAKYSLYMQGNEICQQKNINFIWTRLFYVYGPGQRKESLIPYLINCAREAQTPEIKNPNAKNDFVYVEDVADAIHQILLKCRKSDIFNIGSGKLISIHYIIEKIFKNFNLHKKYIIKNQQQTDSLTSFFADISKIRKEIGWKPKTNINGGIQKTIEYFSSK